MICLVYVVLLVGYVDGHYLLNASTQNNIRFDSNFWNVYSWYLAESTTVTINMLVSARDDSILDNHVDEMLYMLYNRDDIKETIQINKIILDDDTKNARVKKDVVNDDSEKETDNHALCNPSNLHRLRRLSGQSEKAFIIITWNETTLHLALQNNTLLIIPNPRATYLILFTQTDRNFCSSQSDESMYEFIPSLWTYAGVLNFIALTPCACKFQNVYSYDPFYQLSAGSWGMVFRRSMSQARQSSRHITNPLKTFNGYGLKVSIFKRTPTAVKVLPESMQHYGCNSWYIKNAFRGLDGCVLANLAHQLNFSVDIVGPNDDNNYGNMESDGSFNGGLGDVVYKRADISLNSRFMDDISAKYTEYTVPVNNDKICIVVPKAKRIPQWLLIFRCFHVQTWLLLLVAIVIIAIFWNFTTDIIVKTECNFLASFINIFGVIIGIAMPIMVTKGYQRVLLATCLVFNLIIVGIFQGSLFKSFSTISYYSDINTLEDLIKSNLTIVTSINIFEMDDSDNVKPLKSRWMFLNGKAMAIAASRQNIAAVERKKDALFLIQTKYLDSDGFPLLHVMKECASSTFLAYIMPMHSPYLPRINGVLMQFLESGLTNKWYQDVVDGFIMSSKFRNPDNVNILKSVFSVNDLKAAFYSLGVGLGMALMVLGYEILRFNL